MSQQPTPIGKGKTVMSLIISALRTFIIGVIALGALLFLPAWTFHYWQAWTFIIIIMVLITSSGVYFSINDPALIERRKLSGKRAQSSTGQNINITYVYITEIGLLVLSALDHRFGWSYMPAYLSVIGSAVVILANVIWYYSKRENSFAGSAIKIYEGQRLISTGPYALVRHPNYAGDLTLVVGIPFALGSWWGLLVFALIIPGVVWMILDEERLLKRDLPGYEEYTRKVRYRLVPYLW